MIEINIHRVCTFVWSSNAHTGVDNVQIAFWQIVRSCTVYKYRIQRLLFFYKLNDIINILWSKWEIWLFHLVPPVRKIDSIFVQNHTINSCDGKNFDVYIFFKKLFSLVTNLVYHCSTNCSSTKCKYFNSLGCVEEELMYSFYRSISVFIFNYSRNTAFVRSLSNCKNINILTRKSIKEF